MILVSVVTVQAGTFRMRMNPPVRQSLMLIHGAGEGEVTKL